MRKEILFAILAGGILGLIIAFGIWRLNATFSQRGGASIEASPAPIAPIGLSLASPTENEVITSSPVTLTGITKAGSFVVVSGEDEDFVVQAGVDGSFEVEVELVGGLNQLVVHAFDQTGSEQTTNLNLVFSTEFAETANETTQETDGEEDEDEVREVVQEKLLEAQNLAIAYMGAATDISTTTIQLRSTDGEILQAAVAENATFATTVGTAGEIAFEDVALGDFVIAMGYTNGNGVLDARRILVTTAPETPSRVVAYGTITSIEGSEVTLEAGGETWTLDFPTTWKGPEISELAEGDTLIATGTADDVTLTIRSIFITNLEATQEE